MTPPKALREPVVELGIDMLDLDAKALPPSFRFTRHNLDNYPWPVADGWADEIHAYEVLEHIGMQGDYESFFRCFNELWRIADTGAQLYASTPAWNGLWALGDPGHTRVINEGTIAFLGMREIVPPASDYREYIRGFWDLATPIQYVGERFFFNLQKAEENPKWEGKV